MGFRIIYIIKILIIHPSYLYENHRNIKILIKTSIHRRKFKTNDNICLIVTIVFRHVFLHILKKK